MILPPYYFHFGPSALLQYYDRLAEQIHGDIYIYNFPDNTGYTIPPETVLAAKNAILIVEYARDKFDEGMDLQQAALEGARLRVRPVVMTAVAFLMGVLPLILATGSNAVARNIMGLALFGGMLVATVIGLYAYPALFVLVGRMSRYEQKRKIKNEKS